MLVLVSGQRTLFVEELVTLVACVHAFLYVHLVRLPRLALLAARRVILVNHQRIVKLHSHLLRLHLIKIKVSNMIINGFHIRNLVKYLMYILYVIPSKFRASRAQFNYRQYKNVIFKILPTVYTVCVEKNRLYSVALLNFTLSYFELDPSRAP